MKEETNSLQDPKLLQNLEQLNFTYNVHKQPQGKNQDQLKGQNKKGKPDSLKVKIEQCNNKKLKNVATNSSNATT